MEDKTVTRISEREHIYEGLFSDWHCSCFLWASGDWQWAEWKYLFIWYEHSHLHYCVRYHTSQFWNLCWVPNERKHTLISLMTLTAGRHQHTEGQPGWLALILNLSVFSSVEQDVLLCVDLQSAWRFRMSLWWLCGCLQKHWLWRTTLIPLTMRPELPLIKTETTNKVSQRGRLFVLAVSSVQFLTDG